jgi:PPK2 family polyphosphate:nucleotide phosphotransferase
MNRYRIKPNSKIDLSQHDPEDTSAFDGDKRDGLKRLAKLNERLADLQRVLYAEGKHKLLIVLQAMDTGGKDGTMRDVFKGVSPQGVRVANFKVPTPEELAHDFLWRVHKQTPGNGEIVIFNRSHYEDVLIVRVHNLVPKTVWQRRYDHIKHFERLITDEGTTILKFFLHISKDEQKKRLEERRDEPHKRWKFNVGDLAERKLWHAYTKAYEDALGKTSAAHAPWFIIPANREWYRSLAVATIIVETLENLKMSYPQPQEDLSGVVVE